MGNSFKDVEHIFSVSVAMGIFYIICDEALDGNIDKSRLFQAWKQAQPPFILDLDGIKRVIRFS